MIRTTLAVAALLVGAGAASAQEVRWRADYAAARKEAVAANKPLLLDFAAEWCGPCKKMEATTFRNAGVVTAVSGSVIPVRVDADKDTWLVKAAGIQAFPTLILLSPEGKVLARREGFADVPTMTAFLQDGLRARPAAIAAQPATPAVQPAAPAVQPAVAVQPAAQPTPVQPAAATVPVTPAAGLLAAARADFAAGRYLACIERCDRLSAQATPEAAEARQLASAITADPQKWRRVIEQLETDLAAARRGIPAAPTSH
ncbi:thioredoxin family protein [bacterium]|nr:thioredoxin family protein [bacterium]